mmetsp:Transcript_2089/g.7070  ORF Transcript_2089/g.7070 Transcript_2089/m.7070 type:complete len:279 (+) Transcript_2089:1263-2099(+)
MILKKVMLLAGASSGLQVPGLSSRLSRGDLLGTVAASVALTTPWSSGAAEPKSRDDDGYAVRKTDDQWRRELSRSSYYVLRRGATERPNSSPLVGEKREGEFLCAGCGTFPRRTDSLDVRPTIQSIQSMHYIHRRSSLRVGGQVQLGHRLAQFRCGHVRRRGLARGLRAVAGCRAPLRALRRPPRRQVPRRPALARDGRVQDGHALLHRRRRPRLRPRRRLPPSTRRRRLRAPHRPSQVAPAAGGRQRRLGDGLPLERTPPRVSPPINEPINYLLVIK